jgi:hypothetical protein
VELKLRDWRRALEQTANHALGCDYVHICLPAGRETEESIRSCRESRIGLMVYDAKSDSVAQLVEARPSDEIWPAARRWLIDGVRYVSGGQE